jgi:hypothetical protein
MEVTPYTRHTSSARVRRDGVTALATAASHSANRYKTSWASHAARDDVPIFGSLRIGTQRVAIKASEVPW